MPSNTSNGKRGGTLKGKSHARGGIKAVITDNKKPVELEGGEAVITKDAVKKHWKKLSEINQDGGGVPIVNPSELEKGKEVEKEHSDTIKKVYSHKIKPSDAPESIAKDHLKEDSKYYSKLSEIEKKEKGGGCGCGKMKLGGNICADEIFEKQSVNGKIKTSKGEMNKNQFRKFIGL